MREIQDHGVLRCRGEEIAYVFCAIQIHNDEALKTWSGHFVITELYYDDFLRLTVEETYFTIDLPTHYGKISKLDFQAVNSAEELLTHDINIRFEGAGPLIEKPRVHDNKP